MDSFVSVPDGRPTRVEGRDKATNGGDGNWKVC